MRHPVLFYESVPSHPCLTTWEAVVMICECEDIQVAHIGQTSSVSVSTQHLNYYPICVCLNLTTHTFTSDLDKVPYIQIYMCMSFIDKNSRFESSSLATSRGQEVFKLPYPLVQSKQNMVSVPIWGFKTIYNLV